MTDNEIIKALECCAIKHNCADCPQLGNKKCIDTAMKGVLELTALQKAEIERLENDIEAKEIEYGDMVDQCKSVEKHLEKAKAEAVKEFAESLKEKAYTPKPYGMAKVVDGYEIDILVKEMVGDADG